MLQGGESGFPIIIFAVIACCIFFIRHYIHISSSLYTVMPSSRYCLAVWPTWYSPICHVLGTTLLAHVLGTILWYGLLGTDPLPLINGTVMLYDLLGTVHCVMYWVLPYCFMYLVLSCGMTYLAQPNMSCTGCWSIASHKWHCYVIWLTW